MLPFIVLLLLFVLMNNLNPINGFKDLILETVLIFSAFIVFLTELLSLFTSLNLMSVVLSWSFVTILILFFLIRNKTTTVISLLKIKNTILHFYKSLSAFSKILLFTIITCLLLLLLQGIIYPPNNWDSLTYHMSRIMHWLSNESVAHYPTDTLRQLHQPPFAEYFIMNVNLLNGNDYLSNIIQFFFLSLSIIALWALLDYFEISRFYKMFSAFLLVTIPSLELQATTTKNDIICGFFLMCIIYQCIKTFKHINLKNFVFLGFAIGLCIFTKGTSYIFLLPVVLLFGILTVIKSVKNKDLSIFKFHFVLIILVIIINLGHFSRNYRLGGNILSVDKVEEKMYSNEKMNVSFLVSNLLKNAGLHLGYPIFSQSDELIRDFHKKFEIDINNPELNYYGMKYQVSQDLITHEDGVSNTTHFILIFVSFVLVLIVVFKKTNNRIYYILYLIVFISQLFLFSGILKWQVWHTRLHIPLFMMGIPLIIFAITEFKLFKYVLVLILPILIFSFSFFYLYNNIRPIITNPKLTRAIKIDDCRYKKYFANQMNLYSEYDVVQNLIFSNNSKKIGLILSDWEYPLFCYFYFEKINIVSINGAGLSKTIKQNNKNIDAIISNAPKELFIEFDGATYNNLTPNNINIYFYKKL